MFIDFFGDFFILNAVKGGLCDYAHFFHGGETSCLVQILYDYTCIAGIAEERVYLGMSPVPDNDD